MSAGWVVVAKGDLDVEPVEGGRALLAECPSCGAKARLVERELVRNLKVLGVPLLATERAGRVFQCPLCEGLCVREGDALPLGVQGEALDDARAEALTERVLKAEDESVTWTQRAVIAAARGDDELAAEMRAQAERSSRISKALQRELAQVTGTSLARSAADETAQGRVVGAAPAAPEEAPGERPSDAEPLVSQEDQLEDELAALRARVAGRRRPADVPAAEVARAEGAGEVDELAGLKAKLGRSAVPGSSTTSEDASVEAPTPAEEPGASSDDDAGEDDGDDEFAAMKRRLRKKR